MSDLRIQDGKVLCPQCGSPNIAHAFTCECIGKVRVEEGQIIAYGHNPDNDLDSDPYVYCWDCNWISNADDVGIAE